MSHEPNIIAPGHGKPFLSNKADLENLKRRLEGQLAVKAGSSANLELRVRNYRSRPMHLEAALVLPTGWKASPALLGFTIPAGQDGAAPFSLSIPAD